MFDDLTRGEARMLQFLLKQRRSGRTAWIGEKLYSNDSPRKPLSSNPWTLPAAKMLRRLKEKGLARSSYDEQHSVVWSVTPKARKQAEQIGRPLIEMLFEGDDDA